MPLIRTAGAILNNGGQKKDFAHPTIGYQQKMLESGKFSAL